MRIEFVGRNVTVDETLREMAAERLAPVVRLLDDPIEVQVEVEASSGAKRRCAVDIHLRHRAGLLTARSEGVELEPTLVEAAAGIESQARRARKRVVDRRRRAGREAAERRHWPVDVLSRESLRGGERPRVLRSSRLEIEPTDPRGSGTQARGLAQRVRGLRRSRLRPRQRSLQAARRGLRSHRAGVVTNRCRRSSTTRSRR